MILMDKAKAKIDKTVSEPIRNIGLMAIFAIVLGTVALLVAVSK